MNQHQTNYATERAALLFGCYRRGDANDPDTYVAAVAAVLSVYEPGIIRDATDPRTGIQTDEKFAAFMPNAGELKRYCDGIAARQERLKQLAAIPPPSPRSHRLAAPPRPAGYFANVHVPQSNARYARLVEWAKSADEKLWRLGHNSKGEAGLWIPLDVWQGNGGQPVAGRAKFDWANIEPTKRDLTATPELRAAMAQRLEPETGA
jgi:hypothetical protein